MKLTTGRTKLYTSLKNLSLHWEETRRTWNDPVRQEFEEDFLTPLQEQTQLALRAIDRLSETLGELYRDCE